MTLESPPQTAEAVYERLPAVVAGLVGGTRVPRIDPTGSPLALLPFIRAAYLPRDEVVSVHPEIAARLGKFFQTTGLKRRSLSVNEMAERFHLGLVKSDMALVISAVLRGVAPDDASLALTESETLWQQPWGHTLANGIPEALSHQLINPVIQALGLDARDPRLLEIEAIQTYYTAQTGVVNAVIGDLARGRGSTMAAELAGLLACGSGQIAQWQLARRLGGHAEFGRESALGSVNGMYEFDQALRIVFGDVTREWAESPGIPGFEQDQASADRAAASAHRVVRTAARRALDGPGNVIDIDKFAIAITAAAEAEMGEVDNSMDFLAMAWDAAESEGVE